ncbi:hypothetical protein SLEP1_g56619 [Rubroshorea leprosula]|uniref:Uncharacterized protein n=1 Tax=Rubroshorea leprosula TaxID=152421 RepID=A0AAV5MIV3_9ROSI|nr:hypothetical protein SLEP1_g56619 [Rubroshorea leprosula]
MEELDQTAYHGRDQVQLGLAAASLAPNHPIRVEQNQTGGGAGGRPPPQLRPRSEVEKGDDDWSRKGVWVSDPL